VTGSYNAQAAPDTKVECSSSVTGPDAKSTVTVTLVLDSEQITMPPVGLEKKNDKWVGFALSGARADEARWIWVEITGKKMKYKAQMYSYADATRKWDLAEVEINGVKERKYTFEGGTVEYSGQNPFETGSRKLVWIIGITLAVLAVLSISICAAVFMARKRHLLGISGMYNKESLINI
jgi:hypothetical protein